MIALVPISVDRRDQNPRATRSCPVAQIESDVVPKMIISVGVVIHSPVSKPAVLPAMRRKRPIQSKKIQYCFSCVSRFFIAIFVVDRQS